MACLLEATSTLQFAAIRRRLVRNFAPFAAAGTGRALPRRLDKPPLDAAALDSREDAFLADFHALLQAAHFRVLSGSEWATAQAENFTFNSPVEVNWKALDTGLLSRFWSARPGERARAAPVADRILIYHRGVKTVRAEGRFIDDKVDLLVGYALVGPLTRLVAAVGRLVGRGRGGGRGAPPVVGDTSAAGGDVALALQRAVGGGGGAPGAEAVSAADAAAEAMALEEELSHANAQVRNGDGRERERERGMDGRRGKRARGRVCFSRAPPSLLLLCSSSRTAPSLSLPVSLPPSLPLSPHPPPTPPTHHHRPPSDRQAGLPPHAHALPLGRPQVLP